MLNKKIKKLLRDPNLFFRDMILKKKIQYQNKLVNNLSTSKKLTKYKYDIVIVANKNVNNLERCLNSIFEQTYFSHEKTRVTVLDLGMNEKERKLFLTYPESYVRIYLYNEMLSYFSFVESLDSHYTTFIWGDDFLDVNFIKNTDLFICDDPNKLKKGSIVCTCGYKASTTSEIPRNFSPVTSLLTSQPEVGSSPGSMLVESIFGNFFNTGMLKSFLRRQDGFSFLNFDGLGLYFDIFRSLPDTRSLTISKNSKYLVHDDFAQLPFKIIEWSDSNIFSIHFLSLVENLEISIPRLKKWKVLIQRSVYYFLLKYIKKGLANQSLLDSLSDMERHFFIEAFEKMLNIVGVECINNFNVGCTEQLKIGSVNFINARYTNKDIELIEYDEEKEFSLFRYYCGKLNLEFFSVNNEDVIPSIEKTICHKLFGKIFCFERRINIKVNECFVYDKIFISLDHKEVNIRGLNNKISKNITLNEILKQNKSLKPKFKFSEIYRDCWLFMDRDNQADDNAEHLYRYVQKVKPEIHSYFVLKRDSHDWGRLQKEGFNLLAFGSLDHEKALESCSRIISSHAAQFATDYFKDKRMTWKKFVFLQHGVIHNDQSALFRPDWKKFDIFITSANGEYKSIVENNSPYKFTANEVALTGLPRHDALINSNIQSEKIILVMPTWRPSLLGKVISGTTRELLEDFYESEYAQSWYNLLSNEKLKNAAKKEGYKIVFFPHANIQPYLDDFNLPSHIVVMSHALGSIQELFLKASVMITDYSSVAFEMAYINKPVCYYQFDEKAFFHKGHYNKGYFSYREDGFGPVYNHEAEVVDFVIETINHRCMMKPYYAKKANEFFPFRDGKCCERTLEIIESLDEKIVPEKLLSDAGISIGKERVAEWAFMAYQLNDMECAYKRYKGIYSEIYNVEQFSGISEKYIVGYIDVLISLGYLVEAQRILAFDLNISHQIREILFVRLGLYSSILNGINLNSDICELNYNDVYFYKELYLSGNIASASPYNDLINNGTNHEYGVEYINPVFNESVIELRLLEIQGQYENIVEKFPLLDLVNRQNVLLKAIYIRSLYKLKRWEVITEVIGESSILQGRSGILVFAACYLTTMYVSLTKVINKEDFSCWVNNPEMISPEYRSDIIRYYLLVEKDLDVSRMLIDFFSNELSYDIRVEFSCALCECGQTAISYKYLMEMDVLSMPLQGLRLLGGLAMSYGDYEIAVAALQQACLLQLPFVDKDLHQDLLMARIFLQKR